MLIFSLDTSGPTAGVALWLDGTIVYEAVVKNKMTHSESIMPMTEEAYLRAGLNVKDTDYFCAVTGPGSFTGVRIGVTAVKAMAHAAKKPCIEVGGAGRSPGPVRGAPRAVYRRRDAGPPAGNCPGL